ncbi:uncharacterized protein TRIADDRAFT_58125 [Trichoplax adhaerens]|uniref:Thioredoxin domain-containing protein n=1 Tax=Trichoplax adhaerens TaxID=10228 RepID=B3S0Y0_TRIAD|nr:hypothetical protein TRIADDRAFT_58125 [Trichoplax adhaerens]EDV23469.1 hypothetical protein TRIADDRAFT_58125 [Trichoplax adhaerens]|eukprot:XP_002114379.1 hypothetical protein TRIADDRAFT_58125 [Trichoplax adhaerens]
MDCYSGSWTKDSGSNASRTCLADRPYCRSYHQIQQLNFTREVYRQIFLLDNSSSSDDGRNQLNCLGNFSCPFAVNEVIHMNKTQWLQFANDTLMHNKNCCAVVLFYSSSCSFSAQLAPAYNAIGHIFPNLTTISVNAYDNRYYNIRFGVMGTPTVLIFVRARRILRFNSTATFNNLVQFVSNVTELLPGEEGKLLDE